jgi:hypothetical protein
LVYRMSTSQNILTARPYDLLGQSKCTHLDKIIFDQIDNDYDKIVTLATTVVRARNPVSASTMDISLDIGLIYPLN